MLVDGRPGPRPRAPPPRMPLPLVPVVGVLVASPSEAGAVAPVRLLPLVPPPPVVPPPVLAAAPPVVPPPGLVAPRVVAEFVVVDVDVDVGFVAGVVLGVALVSPPEVCAAVEKLPPDEPLSDELPRGEAGADRPVEPPGP